MSENAQIAKTAASVEPYQRYAFDQFLTYCALGGLIIDDEQDDKLRKMPIYEFCQRVGVDQKTTWRWKHSEGFAQEVRERRDEIVPLARETMAFNQLFMLGMQTQDKRAAVDALKTYLGHFSDLRLPTVKQEVKVEGNFLDMMTAATREGVIEGEIVNEHDAQPQTDTAGSIQDPGALPAAS